MTASPFIPSILPTRMQLREDGRLKHFLSIEGLNRSILEEILANAEMFTALHHKSQKKAPILRGKTIVNLFFENSTRTRTTFELAAKRLAADVTTLNIQSSSAKKGESLLDTIRNLEAMVCDMFIVRHHHSSTTHFIARHCAPHISVINAGDGYHEHPTQAMLDIMTIRQKKGDLSKLKVAIVGDILHSRVARSQIHALNMLNTGEVRVIAPKTLLPAQVKSLGVQVYHYIEDGLKDVDVIIMLRLQKERMQSALLPSPQEFFRFYGLTQQRLKIAKPDAIVMHPGPINRGVEITSEVADGPQSVILDQVTNGLAVRMAIMAMVMGIQIGGIN